MWLKNSPKSIRVSIVTVVFNSGGVIEKAIKSVLLQSYKNIEYVIIDGGSKDNTLDVVKKYQKHVDVLISEKDKGIYDAMNKGVKECSGDVVFFLNADDVFHDRGAVSDAVEAFEKGVDFVYGDVEFSYPLEKKSVRISRAASISNLKSGTMPPHQGTFARRELLLRNPFDISYRSSADFDWFCRIMKKGAIGRKIGRVVATVQIGGVSSGKVSYRETEMAVRNYFGFLPFASLVIKHRIFYLLKRTFSFLGLSIHKG
jgi:glycosyltransferase involved in cell wall biosynthesis